MFKLLNAVRGNQYPDFKRLDSFLPRRKNQPNLPEKLPYPSYLAHFEKN